MAKENDPTRGFLENLPKENLLQIFLNQVDMFVCFKDLKHRYMLFSSSFVRVLGHKTSDELVGKTIDSFVTEEEARAHTEVEDRVMETKTPVLHLEKHLEMSGPRSTIGTIWVSTSIYPLFDNEGNVMGTWSITRDISEEKNTEQKLVQKNKQCDELNTKIHHLSTIDEITGLYNRKYFEEMIRRNMRLFSRVRGRGYSAGFSIVLMDIDHFTQFCSEHGSSSGDVALIYVADILRSCSRSADDVFRVGNDEFALILADTGLPGARVLVSRIEALLARKPLVIDDQEVFLTLSFGFCTYDDQLDASEMIVKADQELFEAKNRRSSNAPKSQKKSGASKKNTDHT